MSSDRSNLKMSVTYASAQSAAMMRTWQAYHVQNHLHKDRNRSTSCSAHKARHSIAVLVHPHMLKSWGAVCLLLLQQLLYQRRLLRSSSLQQGCGREAVDVSPKQNNMHSNTACLCLNLSVCYGICRTAVYFKSETHTLHTRWRPERNMCT
jgi:hypothetical protein